MAMSHDDPMVLERQGWKALSDTGAAASRFYEAVLDQRVVMLLPGGMVLDDRAEIVNSMSSRPWSGYTLEDVRCFQPVPDTAIVTYGVVAQRDGEAYSALMSSVYVRREQGWKLACHQQTPR
jgi:hypothetical protein